jgi:hypothetical protein
MNNSNPELVVLPFQASLAGSTKFLTFDQVLTMLHRGQRTRLRIERSYPGAPHAIGWTIFRRTRRKYLYENEPLFRFECDARKYIRKTHAIHYSQLASEEGRTYSHINL